MYTLGRFIDLIGDILVDQDHKSWSIETKTRFTNAGVRLANEARPDMYTKLVDVTLIAGEYQTLPDSTIALASNPVSIKVDANGNTSTASSSEAIDDSVSRAFSFFKQCNPLVSGSNSGGNSVSAVDSQWELKGFVFDARNPTLLKVTPAVPVGQSPKIKMSLQQTPPYYTWPADKNTAFPEKYIGEITEATLYYTFLSEQESELAYSRASDSMKRFQAITGLNYRMQSRMGSGFFLGQKGTGDEAVIRG